MPGRGFWLSLFVLATAAGRGIAATKYNIAARVFEDVKAINFADPLKNGFRVILTDDFIKTHVRHISLPTLYVSAIPLRSGERRTTQVLYPEMKKFTEDKLVTISHLKEESWYYVCVEWENINRHNDTTGTNCRLYRTLDRFGKSAKTTLGEAEVISMTADHFRFKIKFEADFPMRLTAYLKGGDHVIAAQTFRVEKPGLLDVAFPFLEPVTNYGQFCIMEEPLVWGYTAMGRLVSGLTREKCYFEGLKTKPADEELPMATEPAKAFKRVMNSGKSASGRLSNNFFLFLAIFAFGSILRC